MKVRHRSQSNPRASEALNLISKFEKVLVGFACIAPSVSSLSSRHYIQIWRAKVKPGQLTPAPLALIVGATGGIGGTLAGALLAKGWRVRALHRDPVSAARARPEPGIEWITGDALEADTYCAAARGARVIIHAANPPRYQGWRTLALPMLGNAIGAARASGARLVFPGNVYNYGPAHWRLIAENTPQEPMTRKGRIRVEMEAMLKGACAAGEIRALVIRAGDFFGPGQRDSWLTSVMIKPGQPVKRVVYPGTFKAGHSWAYLPDLADTVCRLLDIEESLAAFESFHFGGHWFEHGVDFADAIRRAGEAPGAPIAAMSWLPLRLAAPVVPLFRELLEMRYLWQNAVQLDDRKLVAALGAYAHTPIDEALRVTLESLGCLPPTLSAAGMRRTAAA